MPSKMQSVGQGDRRPPRHDADVPGADAPRYYRRHGRLALLVPNTWGTVHAWFFVIFFVATFGPMFGLWATSTRIVWGWPISMGWILGWMILQSINLIVFYFTTVRSAVRFIDTRATGAEDER